MGEAYKGLTIRFGGDTTNLTAALRGVEYKVSSVNTNLRKLQQALKFDPANVIALNAKLELTRVKSVALSERFDDLAERINQLGNGQSAAQLVANMDRVAEKAKAARVEYDTLQNSIASIKRTINSFAEANGLSEVFDSTSKGLVTINEAEAAFREFSRSGTEAGKIAAQYLERLRQLRVSWVGVQEARKAAEDETDAVKLATEYMKLGSELETIRKEYLSLEGISLFDDETVSAQRFRTKLSDVSETLDQCERKAMSLREAFVLDPTSLEKASAYLQETETTITQCNNKMAVLKERIAKLGENQEVQQLASDAVKCREAFVRAADATASLEKELGALRATETRLNSAIEETTTETAEGRKQLGLYEYQLSVTQKQIKQTEEQLRSARAYFDMTQAATEQRKLQTELEETRLRVSRLTRSMEELSTAASMNGSTFTTLGMALTSNFTPAIMMAATYSIQAADDIDSAYRDMRKTVQGTEEDFESLREAAQEFASTHITSADQILEIEAMGGQLGLAVTELEEFAEVASNLDIATDMDTDEIAEQLGQLNNVLQWNKLEFDDDRGAMERYADALVRLGNNMPTQESAISDITSRIASQAQIIGMSTPEVLAWSTAIASTGQNSEAAATAIARTMADIEGAVGEGSEALALFAQIAGESADEFADEWNNKPSDAMQKFIEGLKNLDEEGESVTNRLSELGITGVRQIQALEGLTNTVDVLDDALVMSQDAWDGVADEWGQAGDAATEAAKKSEGFSGQLAILKNNANLLGSEFAESLTPIMSTLNSLLQHLLDITDGLPDGFKASAVAVSVLIAGIGPLATVVGPIITTMKTLNQSTAATAKTIEALSKNLGVAQTEIKSTNKVSNLLKGSLVALGVAAATVIAVEIIDLVKEYKEKQEECEKATDGLRKAVEKQTGSLEDYESAAEDASDATEATVKSYREIKSAIEEATAAQAELSDAINARTEEAGSSISMLSQAQDVISQYANVSGLSAEEQSKLKAAIALVNEQCGTQYTVTDAVNGVIWDESNATYAATSAISEYIEKKKEQIQLSALEETLEGLYQQQYDDLVALADAQETLNDAQKQYNTALENHSPNIVAYSNAVQNAQSQVEAASENLKVVSDQIDNVESSFESLTENGLTPAEEKMLEMIGLTQEEFAAWAASIGVDADTAMKLFAENINAGITPSVAAAMAVTGMTEEEFAEAAINAGYSGSDAVANYAAAILAGSADAKESAETVSDEAGDGLDESKSRAETAGHNFGSGFVDTIKKFFTSSYWTGHDLGSYASTGLYKGIDSNSPSKKAIQAADYFAKSGFIDRIATYNDEAYQTSKTLGEYASEGLFDGLDENMAKAKDLVRDGILDLRDAAQDAVDVSLSGAMGVTKMQSASTLDYSTKATYNFGNITIDAKDLDGVMTAQDFVNMLKRTQRAYA